MELLAWTKRAALVAALGTLVSTAHAADSNAQVQTELQALKARIAELEKKENQNWLTEERTNQIKAIVTEAIADAKTRGQFADGDLQAGYNNGFFIQSADGKNKMVINGYAQFRYTFLNSHTRSGISSSATSGARTGDASGFDFRRARFSLSGNALTPDLTYNFTGDFAGSSSNSGNFQIVDYYLAYRFNPWLNVRAGSFLVPFSYAEYVSSGQQFVEFSSALLPFDPARGLGVSLYGDIIDKQLSYEVNMSDGSKSNTLGKADDYSTTTGKIDNRSAFYGRMQYGSNTADFKDESDLRKDTSTFAWMVGAAGGYESQSAATTSAPGAQSSLTIYGLPVASGRGYTSAALNGDIYRGTVDLHAKYQGFSTQGAVFFQQVNQNPGAGVTFPYGTADSSFFETGYYVQAGYFIVPKTLELAARYGGVMVEGYGQHVDEYTGGINYYVAGHNNKIQADVTWMPRAYTSDTSTGQVVNTEDLLFRLQWQVKF